MLGTPRAWLLEELIKNLTGEIGKIWIPIQIHMYSNEKKKKKKKQPLSSIGQRHLRRYQPIKDFDKVVLVVIYIPPSAAQKEQKAKKKKNPQRWIYLEI